MKFSPQRRQVLIVALEVCSKIGFDFFSNAFFVVRNRTQLEAADVRSQRSRG